MRLNAKHKTRGHLMPKPGWAVRPRQLISGSAEHSTALSLDTRLHSKKPFHARATKEYEIRDQAERAALFILSVLLIFLYTKAVVPPHVYFRKYDEWSK
jgi:hypothetical protein